MAHILPHLDIDFFQDPFKVTDLESGSGQNNQAALQQHEHSSYAAGHI